MAVRNYLNNRDLLSEIHKSKASFGSYVDDEAKQFDIILNSTKEIKRATIDQARKNRADRIQKAAYKANTIKGKKQADFAVDPKSFKKQELVFRIMTYEHIPLDPERKKNPKQTADHHVKCNFPPYQHWRFNDDNELICVGKSHWEGGMQNGNFTLEAGKVTNKLANMYMQLCDRYSMRYNWRGYTYVDEMRGQALLQLAQIGLQFDESKSDNPFAYYTAAITNSFTRVLNIEKRNQNIRDDILEMNDLNPSYTRQHANDESMKKDRGE
jgi:hypothetical protein